jgi:hypothetical protein
MPERTDQPQGQPTLRPATIDDIVQRLTNTTYQWTAINALGWGMGPAQDGITAAVTAAEKAGLVRTTLLRGKKMAQLAPNPTAAPDEQTISLATGYLRNHTRHGEHDAWLTHGRTLATRLGLTGDNWQQRQQLPNAARRITATPTPSPAQRPTAPLPPAARQALARLERALPHPAATQ